MANSIGIFLLSLTGLLISFYFCGVYYRWFSPDAAWIPKVCRMNEGICASIVHRPHAKLFGIPNAVLGFIFYSYLIADLFFFPPGLALVLSAAALMRSLYLAYALIFWERTSCRLCFVSHVLNGALMILLIGSGVSR
ncbi:MAG: vitamin K epoxide reductase family protein [Candidatus Omnitrophica bacterium]|nr:vitamin K epoxide reductase family protein [Candidatus Omnitrophota bacterium]